MQIIDFQNIQQIRPYLERPSGDFTTYRQQVIPIMEAVRTKGDAAVRRYTAQFDQYTGLEIALPTDRITGAADLLSPTLRAAIDQAYQNIRAFHRAQKEADITVETMPGVTCMRRSVAIERVGLYIPGGTAPLFSTVLMLGIPAQLAGCREVVLCTPRDRSGAIHPAVLYAASLCGIRQVFGIGGAQAIAAMAYGTETVPKVWKIFGPGNPWVTAAKQLVALDGMAIDMPAGPSEVAVIADHTARPAFIAADLLSQAEHGADSQVVLICTSASIANNVERALEEQLATLDRADIAQKALQNSKTIVVPDVETAMLVSNEYAPEHLILQTEFPEALAERVTNAGSVFIGHFTPESAGDYASGTNHTLPTNGFARAFAGVSLDSFVKKITFQRITPEGLAALGPVVVEMATAEGLSAHARAVTVRL